MSLTLRQCRFEADAREVMRRAILRGWVKLPAPEVVKELPPPAASSMRICRKASSRVFWRALLTLQEPFTLEDLCRAAKADPSRSYVPRNWMSQRVQQRQVITVGDEKTDRIGRDGQLIVIARYRRCDNFAELAAVALGDAP